MVLFGKFHCVAALRFKIRGIAVEKRIFPVVLLDQTLKVFVLNDDTGQPAGALPDQVKEPPDVAGAAGK